MDFVIRFCILAFITSASLFCASEKWKKYNTWLMVAYLIVTGLIFIV